jgi:hypothetical protein
MAFFCIIAWKRMAKARAGRVILEAKGCAVSPRREPVRGPGDVLTRLCAVDSADRSGPRGAHLAF